MSVEFYKNEMERVKEEDGEDSNTYSYYKIMYEVAKNEEENKEVVESFKGKTKKAISIMKQLNDLDIDEDDPEYIKTVDKLANKVKHYLNSHETDINLKMKELEKLKNEIEIIRMYSVGDYYTRDPTMWFWKIKDLIRDRKKRKGDF